MSLVAVCAGSGTPLVRAETEEYKAKRGVVIGIFLEGAVAITGGLGVHPVICDSFTPIRYVGNNRKRWHNPIASSLSE